ncbi:MULTISPECIES: hypothetical protein [Paraliobacillus]|uniref:hypothetical protein n=1 Tax=Paraliobacillus TaxID=200903 RepID=UPI000E3CE7F6|nr:MULTISPECIES: hypothetical protein [Paraliobacillus]
MIYNAKTQKVLQFLLFIWAVRALFTSTDYPAMYYFLVPFSIFILATVFINFQFKIVEDSLNYKILLFKFIVYKRNVEHKQIDSMKFKRSGWGKRCVIVKNNKGFNFKIFNFYPEKVYSDLIDFANLYSIPITKTKDYVTLEKLN